MAKTLLSQGPVFKSQSEDLFGSISGRFRLFWAVFDGFRTFFGGFRDLSAHQPVARPLYSALVPPAAVISSSLGLPGLFLHDCHAESAKRLALHCGSVLLQYRHLHALSRCLQSASCRGTFTRMRLLSVDPDIHISHRESSTSERGLKQRCQTKRLHPS